jgi:hypothetical protein
MSSIATVSPHGVDVKNLLENAANDVEAYRSTRPPETDTFEAQRDFASTPLLLIDDEPIGEWDDLRRWLARNAH